MNPLFAAFSENTVLSSCLNRCFVGSSYLAGVPILAGQSVMTFALSADSESLFLHAPVEKQSNERKKRIDFHWVSPELIDSMTSKPPARLCPQAPKRSARPSRGPTIRTSCSSSKKTRVCISPSKLAPTSRRAATLTCTPWSPTARRARRSAAYCSAPTPSPTAAPWGRTVASKTFST